MAYTRLRGKKHLACWRGPDGRTRTKGGFTRKRDAQTYGDRQELAIGDGSYIDPRHGATTLIEWWGRWWPTQVGLARKTRDRDEWLWRAYVRPTFGDRALRTITRTDVGVWIAELDAFDTIGPSTVRKAHSLLHKTLAAAVRAQLVAHNPASDADLPVELPAQRRALERDELDKLIGARPDDATWRRYCLIGAYLGPRPGELGGLQWRHHADATLEVDQQITDVNGVLEITRRLKGGARGRRRIPIPGFLDRLLVDERGAPDEWIVSAPAGGPLRADNFRERVWQPACVAAGLGALVDGRYVGIVPHELRHTAFTWWIVNGASLLDVQRWGGHESLRMLERVYGHLVPSHTAEVMGRLDGYGRGA